MKSVVPFLIYKDRKGKFRWRVTAPNGRKLAVSSEGYTRKIDAGKSAAATLEILSKQDAIYNAVVVKS